MTDTFDVTNPNKPTIVKDPDAILDYTWDWTTYLADITDTIVSAQILFPSSTDTPVVALDTAGHGPNGFAVIGGVKVTAWLKSGAAGATYQVTCRIVTAGGRTDDRSIFLKVKDR